MPESNFDELYRAAMEGDRVALEGKMSEDQIALARRPAHLQIP